MEVPNPNILFSSTCPSNSFFLEGQYFKNFISPEKFFCQIHPELVTLEVLHGCFHFFRGETKFLVMSWMTLSWPLVLQKTSNCSISAIADSTHNF